MDELFENISNEVIEETMETMESIYPISNEVIANVTNVIVLISIVIVGMIPIYYALSSIIKISMAITKKNKGE